MKKHLLLIAVVLTIVSCKKDKTEVAEPGILNVFGTWELARTHGNTAKPTKASPNNGNRYVLNSDSTYIRYVSNAIQGQGKFSIQITEVRDSIRFGMIRFTNPEAQDHFQIRSKTILFGTSIADGPVYEYKKIK
jgi:hypothetical protein